MLPTFYILILPIAIPSGYFNYTTVHGYIMNYVTLSSKIPANKHYSIFSEYTYMTWLYMLLPSTR